MVEKSSFWEPRHVGLDSEASAISGDDDDKCSLEGLGWVSVKSGESTNQDQEGAEKLRGEKVAN